MKAQPQQIKIKLFQPNLQQYLTLSIPPTTSLPAFKQLIKNQYWIDEQILIKQQNNGRYWFNGTISEFCQGKDNIQLRLSYVGSKDITMNAMDPEDMRNFRVRAITNAKAARRVFPGCILHCVCKSQNCVAFGREVFINLGFGNQININKHATLSKCPLCNQITKAATNIGFYQCKAVVEGEKSNQTLYKQTFLANDSFYHTFKSDGPQNFRQWIFIYVTVSPR